MYIYCDNLACFTGRNYLTNWVTQVQKPEEYSTAVKLVGLRMCVYTFVLKPVRLNRGVTLNILSHFLYEYNGKLPFIFTCLLLVTNIPSFGKF
jgi:hypothetical protein